MTTLTEARAKVEITRPDNTSAYMAKDTVADSASAPNLLTFYNMCVAGAGAMITKARLLTDQATCTARFRLHLFREAPTTINDNSPYTLLYLNADKRIGQIDFPSVATEDATSTAAASLNDLIRQSFVSANGHLYGILETRDAFTPASGQKFYIELTTVSP